MSSKKRCWVDLEGQVKECATCRKILPFDNFSKRLDSKSGRVATCYQCRRAKYIPKPTRKSFIDFEAKVKECTVCHKILPFDAFHKSSRLKTGLASRCKECEHLRGGYASKEPFIDYDNKIKECSICHERLPFSKFYKLTSAKSGIASKCKVCTKEVNAREKSKEGRRIYAENHKEEIREYRRRNRKELNKKKVAYRKRRLKTDINYRLQYNLRVRLRKALKRNSKLGSAVRDLGCSIEDLKKYLSEKFYNRSTGECMTWDNYGRKGWHIDHIKPLAIFDLTDRQQFLEACHYTNLQPLWFEDNVAKGARE